ncbi:MAG TPA: serine/threonine-protein kinase [Dokdonella sp.]
MDAREKNTLLVAREALDLPPGERAAFVERRCGADVGLHAAVEAFLSALIGVDDDEAAAARDDRTAESADALLGARLGPFRVVERIGRGGMGVVYRGVRESDGFRHEVALKLIRRGFDFDDVQARFLRERRILSRLSHPNLARFVDGGVAPDGRPWFALDYVRGTTIVRWCDDHALDVRARVRLFVDVCAAVQYAHTQLVVHRDLKPANVLVDDDGRVRLLDFGLARLLGGDDGPDDGATTIGGRAPLTPEYAAPEQIAGEPGGVASDVYSLGAILYELIAGLRPPAAQHGRDVRAPPLAAAITRTPSAPADADVAAARVAARATSLHGYRRTVRGDLTRIVDTALAAEPARRYATVAALADDLERWLGGAPVRVCGDRLGYRARKFAARNAAAVAVAGALTLALIAASAWALRSASLERQRRDEALAEAARSNAIVDYVMLMFRDTGEQRDAGGVSARDVLRSGASHIAERFAGEPETGQLVALKLAGLYARLGDTEGATPLLEQVLAWPGIERNPDAQADARAQLAEVEYFRSHVARAHALLDQARAWWSTDPARYAKALNESLITRSQIERAEGHADASIATLEQAIEGRRALLGQPDRSLGIALGTLSVSLIQAGRYDDAWRRADEAIQVYAGLGERDSVAALAALSNRGTAAMNAGRLADAERDLRDAVERRRSLYGPSPELAQTENNLGLVLEQQGRAAEAIALFEDGLQMAIERGGETTRYALPLRGNLAEAYVAASRVAEAEALAEAAVSIATASYGATSPFVAAAKRARAAVRIAQKRPADARADLDAAAAIFTAMGASGARQLATLDPLRRRLAAL